MHGEVSLVRGQVCILWRNEEARNKGSQRKRKLTKEYCLISSLILLECEYKHEELPVIMTITCNIILIITVFTHVMNALFFSKIRSKVGGAFIMRDKLYENFFGMRKIGNVKKKS